MPIIAVAGAFAGASALATGTLTAFQTIAAVGSIVGGIGAVTGNKTMMKIGAVAGLAGGIGAFAQGQGWIGDGGASSAADAVSMADDVYGGSSLSAGSSAMDIAASQASAFGDSFQPMTDMSGGGLMDSGPIAATASTPATDMSATQTANPLVAQSPTVKPTDVAKPVPGKKGVLDTLSGFFDNKDMKSIAANFVGGMFDEEKKQKAEYYKTAADTARAKMENGKAVPRMDFRLKPKEDIFNAQSPTYNGVRPSGLMFAGK